jgi:antitoxin (DNA-binding transcriptional repressor) of toxin-antitoxin stability system
MWRQMENMTVGIRQTKDKASSLVDRIAEGRRSG